MIWYIAHDTDNDTRTILHLANRVNEKPMCQMRMKLCMCCGWNKYTSSQHAMGRGASSFQTLQWRGFKHELILTLVESSCYFSVSTSKRWSLQINVLKYSYKALRSQFPPRIDGSLKRSVPEYACGNLSLWAQLPASVSQIPMIVWEVTLW